MRQYEAVIAVMEAGGGFATLGQLYQEAMKIGGVKWGTKTPFASIRRIVQDERHFFKIKPGLWALKSWANKLPAGMAPKSMSPKEQVIFDHTYYQGLVVEIGKSQGFSTYVPGQDKNKNFLGKAKLGDMADITAMPKFSYDEIVARAKSIDVIWFNGRKLPGWLFEVEHSTDIKNSLLKFVELCDFRTEMVIVADGSRKAAFKNVAAMGAFKQIDGLVRFWDYGQLVLYHEQIFKTRSLERELGI